MQGPFLSCGHGRKNLHQSTLELWNPWHAVVDTLKEACVNFLPQIGSFIFCNILQWYTPSHNNTI